MTRVILSCLLALMLAVTSQSMASAKGASAATGQMVLCTGTGPMVVYIDAEGQPTSAPHFCPECALNALTDNAVPWVMAALRLSTQVFQTQLSEGQAPRKPSVRPPSRAPPCLI